MKHTRSHAQGCVCPRRHGGRVRAGAVRARQHHAAPARDVRAGGRAGRRRRGGGGGWVRACVGVHVWVCMCGCACVGEYVCVYMFVVCVFVSACVHVCVLEIF